MESFIKVYPNPASDHLTIEYSFSENQAGIFVMYDVLGKEVMNKILSANKKRAQFNLTQLNSGLFYYCIIANNNAIARDKIIIIKKESHQ